MASCPLQFAHGLINKQALTHSQAHPCLMTMSFVSFLVSGAQCPTWVLLNPQGLFAVESKGRRWQLKSWDELNSGLNLASLSLEITCCFSSLLSSVIFPINNWKINSVVITYQVCFSFFVYIDTPYLTGSKIYVENTPQHPFYASWPEIIVVLRSLAWRQAARVRDLPSPWVFCLFVVFVFFF